MKFKLFFSLLLLMALTSLAWADKAQVAKQLSAIVPGVTVEGIHNTPVEGLYEVTIGPRVLYATADGRYVIQGNLLDLESRKNLTKPAEIRARQAVIRSLGDDQLIRFNAKNQKHVITVFSDIDCAYCRKLHSEIDQYLDAGISIHYLLYPRTQVGSPSYDKAVSVWCADDRKEALTRAKLKDEVVPKTCDNPVRRNMELGAAFGVEGTPALLLESGEMLPGYIPAKSLQQYFAQQAAAAAQ